MRVLITVILAASFPAVAQSDRAGKLESLLAEAHEAQARSDYRAAADAYRQALAIQPDVAELWSNLGLMQYESHEYPTAEDAFRRALGINRSLFVPNLFLGLDLLELKRPRNAVEYLLAAHKVKPQDAQVLIALGRAFHASFDPARSREWYQRAVDLAPGNGDAWFGLGVVYLDLAESASAKLTGAFAQSEYVAELTADALAEQRRVGALESRTTGTKRPVRSTKPIERYPLAPERPLPALGNMTEHELEQFAGDTFSSADFRAAAAAAERLEHQYPSDAAGWYWAVRAYQQLGVAALARAGEVEPESPRMHALLGDAYQRRKMFREAEAEYSNLLTLAPDDIGGLTGLAAAYLHDGRLDDAQVAAKKALARDPQDSEINLLMGEILVARHEYTEAEPYLERSLHARPDLLPRVHALRGRVFARTGRSKEAIDELTQGLASDEDGSVYYQLGRLYESSGDAKAAAAAFEKSQQIRAKRDVAAKENLAPVQ